MNTYTTIQAAKSAGYAISPQGSCAGFSTAYRRLGIKPKRDKDTGAMLFSDRDVAVIAAARLKRDAPPEQEEEPMQPKRKPPMRRKPAPPVAGGVLFQSTDDQEGTA